MAESAFAAIIKHHDILRLRVEQSGNSYKEHILAETDDVLFSICDMSEIPGTEIQNALLADANSVQASLDIFDGPVLRARFYQTPGISRVLSAYCGTSPRG